MASLLKRFWSGLDVWDKEENRKQREEYARPQPRPQAQTPQPDSVDWKIRNAKYGVLANNRAAQDKLLEDTKAKKMNMASAALGSAIDATKQVSLAPPKAAKALGKSFWETADVAKAAVQRDQNNFRESLDQSIIGGVQRFGQPVASTILSPYSNRLAQQESDRAKRLLTPAYENMYRKYGADPRLGANQAQVEAGAIDYGLRTDPLNRSGINVNDSTGTVTRKVAAKGAEAALDILTAPAMGLAVKSAVTSPTKQFVKNTLKSGALSAGGNLAYTAQQDGVTPLDYAKAGGVGFTIGAALPIATKGATEGIKTAKTNLIPPSRLNPNEVADLALFRQKAGTPALDEATYQRGVAAADKAGVDYRDPDAVDNLIGAHRTFENNRLLKPLNERGSIQIGKNGNKYVKVDTDQQIFDGLSPRQQAKEARKYLSDNFSEKKISVDKTGNVIFTSKGNKKFTNPKVDLPPESFNAKMRLTPELDNALNIAKYDRSSPVKPGKHSSYAPDGFDYHTFEFEVGGKRFKGVVNVGKNGEIKKFYDVTPIIEKSPAEPLGSKTTSRFESADDSNTSIPNPTTPVNPIRGLKKLDDRGSIKLPGKGSAPQGKTAADYIVNMKNEDAARPAEFEAVAARAGSKSSKKLEQALVSDARINEKLKEAQLSGEEVNFYAKKDKNGRSVGVEAFNPNQHRIEAGFVIDNDGKVLGNHIKVDSTGVQVNVGGDLVNMDAVIGNPSDWQGSYRMMETMDRNLKRNAPDEGTYRRTREFLIDNKIKNEANFREELRSQRQTLASQAKDVQSVRPSNVGKDDFNSDVFDFIEGKTGSGDIKAKYGGGARAIIDYKNSTRQLYDNLLDRVNEVFAKYGEAPVPKRKDYITHINELMEKPSFAGEMFGQLQNTILGEGMQTTRKSVPGSIAGRTETFEPRKRWNRFFQARKGGDFTKDPFKAVDAYLEPTLYNIHMTESAVRARAVETAFRTADEIRNMDKQGFTQALTDGLEKYRGGDNSKLITGFQEFANALAGKTQRFDRQIVDASKGTEMGLRGWQSLQRIGGRGTILGNAQSVLSQTLNQPLTLADTGVKNYLRGITSSMTNDTPIDKSPFIRARATKVDSPFRSGGQKVLDAGGVPLEKVELAMVKNTWNAEYHKAVDNGFRGQKAIMEADRATEQVVAGRGIADRPEAYRSTATNGFLQYTLEVAASNKKFWQDLNPKQKATFVAAVFGANSVFGLVTGYEPLPDFLGAAIDTTKDFANSEDDRSTAQKAVGGAQRFASEAVEMNPLASATVNTLLNKEQRKAVFGEDSSLGRFEGTAAPVQVARNTVDAAGKLTKGQYGAAASSAVKNIPFGNQANKTTTSAAMIKRGYAVDSKGERTFDAPSSLAGKTQALLFGPNSTKSAKQYYNEKDQGLTKDQREQLRDAPADKREEFKRQLLARNKADNKRKEEKQNASKDSTTGKLVGITEVTKERQEKLKASMSPDDWDIYQMSEAERKEVVKQGIKSQADIDGLIKYAENKKKEYGYPDNKTSKLPSNINPTARAIYDEEDGAEDKAKWAKQSASNSGVKNIVNSWLPQGVTTPPVTNATAKKWADYEKRKAEGTLGKIEETEVKRTILKDAYNSQLNEDEKDLYSLSEAKLQAAIDRGLINDKNIENALAVEKQLFDAGLIDKETLARKLDLGARGYKTGKSGSRKGRKGRKSKGSKADTPDISKVLQAVKKSDIGRAKQSKLTRKKPSIPTFKVATPQTARQRRRGNQGIKVSKTNIA